jgi:hypothetical protein
MQSEMLEISDLRAIGCDREAVTGWDELFSQSHQLGYFSKQAVVSK